MHVKREATHAQRPSCFVRRVVPRWPPFLVMGYGLRSPVETRVGGPPSLVPARAPGSAAAPWICRGRGHVRAPPTRQGWAHDASAKGLGHSAFNACAAVRRGSPPASKHVTASSLSDRRRRAKLRGRAKRGKARTADGARKLEGKIDGRSARGEGGAIRLGDDDGGGEQGTGRRAGMLDCLYAGVALSRWPQPPTVGQRAQRSGQASRPHCVFGGRCAIREAPGCIGSMP